MSFAEERFSGCLYRDQSGHKVVADVEGTGSFELRGEGSVTVDGAVGAPRVGTFREFLLAHGENAEVIIRRELLPGSGPFELLSELTVNDPSSLKAVRWSVSRASKVTELSSLAEGGPFVGPVMSHLNDARFQVTVPKHCQGLLLAKLYDRFHGRQRARVLVNDHPCGIWYCPRQDRAVRWAWDAFGIRPEFIDGPGDLEVAIDPPAGTPLWSVSRLRIYALMRGE